MKLSITAMLSVPCPGCGAHSTKPCPWSTPGLLHGRPIEVQGLRFCNQRAARARELRKPTPAEWDECGRDAHRTIAPDGHCTCGMFYASPEVM